MMMVMVVVVIMVMMVMMMMVMMIVMMMVVVIVFSHDHRLVFDTAVLLLRSFSARRTFSASGIGSEQLGK